MPFGGLLVNRRTKRQYRVDGCRKSRKNPLLALSKPFISILSGLQLPKDVDLRPWLGPIEEQRAIGSCVGNALASILEYFYFSTMGRTKRFSRLFIYYNARMLEDEVSQRNATEEDSGADIQYAILGLLKFGCCEEIYWPFYQHLINVQPNEEAYENARNYRLDDFRRLSNNITQLRECLSQGYPFIMAIKIFSSFASNHHGYIPMPKRYEKASKYRHAVVCVGYINSQRVFIIRNSHGIQWGDYGYGYLPYDYVTDKILTKDLWALKSVENFRPLSIENHKIWNEYPTLSKSGSQQDMLDDRSECDIEYSNYHENQTAEEEEEEEEEPVELDAINIDREERPRRHPQELQRIHAASAVGFHENYWMPPPPPPYVNHYPVAYAPTPNMFMTTPYMEPFPYQSRMFNSTPFFRPF